MNGERQIIRCQNFEKVSGGMQKILNLGISMYTEYEKNLADGNIKSIPHVTISDWRDACLKEKIYPNNRNCNRAMASMENRKLIYLDENRASLYPEAIYLKYFGKDDTIEK